MKMIIYPILLTLLASTSVSLSQGIRTWTNKNGKTIRGNMVEKTDTSVTVKVNSRKFTLQLDTLSKEDQEYVKGTEISTPIDFDVRTEKSATATKRSKSERKIKVSLGRLRGRTVTVKVYWIGEGDTREDIGLFSKEEKSISSDGDHFFEVTFPDNTKHRTSNKFDHQHKAHIVVLCDEDGTELQRYESNKGYDHLAK